jgi:thioredoxin-related protein
MKETIVIIFVLSAFFCSKITFSQNEDEKIKWYSFEEAVKLNKENPKKLFVDVYTDWCGWCKKMDATTFSNPVIIKYMNENYYPVKFDAESIEPITFNGQEFVNNNPNGRRSSHELANTLLRGKMSYPSYVFLNEKNELITVVSGYLLAEKLEPILHYFGEDAYLSKEWPVFQKTFKGEIE